MSLNKNNIFIFLLVILHSAFSQKMKIDSLETTVITATRTKRQLSSLPLPVTLVSKETIQKSGSLRLNEILEEQTGIVTVPDQSGFEGMQIQGLESEYISILIDGVPLLRGRTAGNFDLKQLAVGNIKQIEVVKGPSSALYGSDALGGVINIITDIPTSKTPKGSVSYRNGTFVEQDINLNIGQRIGKLTYSLYANRFSSDGYDLNRETEGVTVTPFENYTFGGKFIYKFNKNIKNTTSVRTYTEYQDILSSFENEPLTGSSKSKDYNIHNLTVHQWNEKFDMEYELYFTQLRAKERVNGDANARALFNTDFDNKLFRPEIRAHYRYSDNVTFTLGVGATFDYLDRVNFSEAKNFNSQYVYGQADIELLNRINFILGARQDWHSEYDKRFSPKGSIRFKINDHWALKGSVGSAFKAPAFRQLFLDFTNSAVGYTVLGRNIALNRLNALDDSNLILRRTISDEELRTPLKAETSVAFNSGFTYNNSKLKAEVNYFRNNISNLIDTFVIGTRTNAQNVFSYQNIESIRTEGIEINFTLNPIENLKLSGGYQLLYHFDNSIRDDFDNGKSFFARRPITREVFKIEKDDYFGLFNRSKHHINIKLFYNWAEKNTSFSLRTIYRSKYGLFDDNGNGILDVYDGNGAFVKGFTITNATVTKHLKDFLDIQIGSNNLFNVKNNPINFIIGRRIFGKITYNF